MNILIYDFSSILARTKNNKKILSFFYYFVNIVREKVHKMNCIFVLHIIFYNILNRFLLR